MNYAQWLQIIEIIFWIAIISSCLLAILRGRVVAIQFLYPMIFLNITNFNSYFQNYFNNPEVDQGLYHSQTFFVILIAAITIIGFNYLCKHYLFWGIDKKTFIEVIHNIIQENNLKFVDKGENAFIIKEYPDDLYRITAFSFIANGTALDSKNIRKNKADQFKLISKLKDALLGYSMNMSGKIFLMLIILFTCFILYFTFQIMI
jgi:hypothetical protein